MSQAVKKFYWEVSEVATVAFWACFQRQPNHAGYFTRAGFLADSKPSGSCGKYLPTKCERDERALVMAFFYSIVKPLLTKARNEASKEVKTRRFLQAAFPRRNELSGKETSKGPKRSWTPARWKDLPNITLTKSLDGFPLRTGQHGQ